MAAGIAHGTLRAYVISKCRCDVCTEANRVYNNRVNRARAYGQWQPYVDAQPARDHLHLLADYGIGWMRAATLAGVSHGGVSKLLYGTPTRPQSKRIRPETEAKILAVRPILANLADCARTDGTGATRRLRALIACGFTGGYLADRLGIQQANFSKLLRSTGKVEASTARTVIGLYDELWDADPLSFGISRQGAEYARTVARKNGWPVPMAWGEEIDDPAFTPGALPEDPRPLVLAEDAEFIRRTTGVEDLALIADRLGVTRGALSRNLVRAKVLTREPVAA